MPITRFGLGLLLLWSAVVAQQPAPNEAGKSISEQLKKLRSLPDDERARVTMQLALQIREAPPDVKKGLAGQLANLSTEGDFGRDTLQAVTTTLEQALRESPSPAIDGRP